MPVPFILATGFLGSGKTTLLKRFLHQYADERRIAIIQNEFAPAGVDGHELRATGKHFEILEINKGSVFCVCLLSDFVSSLAQLVNSVTPDAVILEATGLADPIALAQLLEADQIRDKVYLGHVFCVVDASTFPRMATTVTRVAHQVRIADTIIVNKADLVDNAEPVEAQVRGLNPFAAVRTVSHCDTDLAGLLDGTGSVPVALQRAHEHTALESSGRPAVGSVAIRTTQPVERGGLERFIAQEAPGAYRLKGYVRLSDGHTVAIQS
ncbi:MAG: hypothetical protein GF331_10135, partial [Chitinivibrionales bacterium]|nr:hypothetical protein [Chitinivibrionales bacterium]